MLRSTFDKNNKGASLPYNVEIIVGKINLIRHLMSSHAYMEFYM